MKSLVSLDQPLLAVSESNDVLPAFGTRVIAYLSLTKPRLVLMVLITVAVGYLLGARGQAEPATLAMTLLGTSLVAGGAGALNQALERARDGMMRRTAGRALPSGRLSIGEAVSFGVVLSIIGTTLLILGANPLAAAVALVTLLLYVLVYTPLKPLTSLNTVVGAIPGALPPMIGWGAATGRLGIEAWALFLIVFLWQFPHFLAIAWIYREDYRRAGFRMLTARDDRGRMTGCQAVSYALALIPAGLLPAVVGLAGSLYFVGALVLGLVYLVAAARFWMETSDLTARRLLRTSFIYLPAILLLLLFNPISH
ncbi:MAG: heme o synthase [Isosphaeraceae bacterium]